MFKIKISKENYNNFGMKYNHDVYLYYLEKYEKGEKLNIYQLVYVMQYLVNSWIDNGGLWPIWIESLGQYNSDYLGVLEEIGDKKSYNIFLEFINIFEKYKKSFMAMEVPEEWDEESNLFSEKEIKKANKIDKEFQELRNSRESFFINYIKKHKNEIISKKNESTGNKSFLQKIFSKKEK